LLSHDRQCGAGHKNDAVEVRIDQRLEPLRAQLLKRRDITVACIIHNDVQTPERLYGGLHR
jgi:hypothetical protein